MCPGEGQSMDVPYLILVGEVLKVAKSVALVSATSVESLGPSTLVSGVS